MWSTILRWLPGGKVGGASAVTLENAAVRVLMVCRANQCRSPMAEGALRQQLMDVGLAGRVFVDSAGTRAHEGVVVDLRSKRVAERHGVNLAGIRSRQVAVEDIVAFDYILAMDTAVLEVLQDACPPRVDASKICLLMDFAPEFPEREVPDPYYGSFSGFERVMDMIVASCRGLVQQLREHHSL